MRVVDSNPFDALETRAEHRSPELERIVAEIVAEVRQKGDEALLASGRKFDAPDLSSLTPTEEEWARRLPADQEAVIEAAYERILSFHRRQYELLTSGLHAEAGGFKGWRMPNEPVGQRLLPVSAAGLYVPGGNAAYPSSVLMLSGPANAADVPSLAVTTPALRDGTLPAPVLAACRAAGVKRVFKIGGAAAIAALALGTETVPKVDKIAGPGNKFVNEAKRQLWGSVGLDGYAGPSEVCVLADDSANTFFAAADLITQVEHAPDNAAFLVVVGEPKLREILSEVQRQAGLHPTAKTIQSALSDLGMAFLARDMAEAVEIVNEIAPEHLTVAVEDPDSVLPKIRNAGCILVGDWTPESVADYCLGPSHTLPTGGAARFASPVNVLDFLKLQSIGRLSKAQLGPLIGLAEAFAAMEGFPAHGFGASVRRKE